MEIKTCDWKEFLRKEWDINIDAQQEKKFAVYAGLLRRYNQYFNLTRLDDLEEIYFYHFVDSLAGYYYIRKHKICETTLLDIGSGAGFPGIPIKIVWPQAKVILIESNSRKKNFLDMVIAHLNLSDIEAKNVRAENLSLSDLSAIATLRAVGKISEIIRLLKNLKQVKYFLWYATEKLYQESENFFKKTKLEVIPGDFYSWPGLKQRRLIVGIKRENYGDETISGIS